VNDRYLVTGGGGFIGSHLCARLLQAGRKVTVIDNFSTGARANLDGLAGDRAVVEGSITEPATLAEAMQSVRGVFHLAALPSVARSLESPLDSHLHNATGTLHVLHAAVRQAARVVYAGSSSAYGNQEAESKHEGLREDPLSPYAASKLAGELYCRAFARAFGLRVVIARFFNVFGPRQKPDSPYAGVIAAFCLAALRGTPPRIDGDGLQSRDFTYVEDAVDGTVLAMDKDTPGCEIVNLAYGQSHTLREVLTLLEQRAGRSVQPAYGPPRRGDVRHSLADITRAQTLLGYAPKVGFLQGLERTFDWYRSQYA
jgi:UDP-N-acetylglucosamine/UDP-N-acetyl-alpha-D-glucosaminouronate 4-epimerase